MYIKKPLQTLCQKRFEKRFFVKKLKISCSSDHAILFKFYQHVVQIFFKECMKRFDFAVLTSATAKWRVFRSKLLQKLVFRWDILCFHCWCWHFHHTWNFLSLTERHVYTIRRALEMVTPPGGLGVTVG